MPRIFHPEPLSAGLTLAFAFIRQMVRPRRAADCAALPCNGTGGDSHSSAWPCRAWNRDAMTPAARAQQ